MVSKNSGERRSFRFYFELIDLGMKWRLTVNIVMTVNSGGGGLVTTPHSISEFMRTAENTDCSID